MPSPLASTPITRARCVPITSVVSGVGDDREVPDPEVEDAAQLVLVDMPREPLEDGRALPGVPVDLGGEAVGKHAREVALDPAAGDVREGVRAAAQPADVVEVEPRGREQVVAVVVLRLEDAPDEREAVRVDSGRREADDRVSRLDPRAVDETLSLHDPDARAREVELLVAVDPGQLGGLAADERDPGRAADLGRALDELRDLLELDPVRGDVVEEEQRVGAARDDVVDAVRREVGAAVPEQRPARGRGSSFVPTPSVEAASRRVSSSGCSPANAPNPVAPVDSDGRAQALDDRVRLVDRDPRGRVGLLPRLHPRESSDGARLA